jgi:hypothetical protein
LPFLEDAPNGLDHGTAERVADDAWREAQGQWRRASDAILLEVLADTAAAAITSAWLGVSPASSS